MRVIIEVRLGARIAAFPLEIDGDGAGVEAVNLRRGQLVVV